MSLPAVHTHTHTHTHTAIVGHCDLSSPDVETILRSHALSRRMRGIRHMLNYHPEHPKYSEASHDGFLTEPLWLKGLALLEKYGMSFELHILPRQMMRWVDRQRERGKRERGGVGGEGGEGRGGRELAAYLNF